ncbi:MAG: type V CRISPR-associated protein Cas4 [Clostridia bacterium]|nr:type V CRISPR-associated protein Cas4 [Clostridia bacterium]MDD4387493.1 type V CRISPR-associated protein Cas4 [Clostridia bacterium]
MEETILITELNDYVFCPVSIYFHKLYGRLDKMSYHREEQTKGRNAHKTIDTKSYTTSKNVIQSLEVYTEEFNIRGKIDLYYKKEKLLVERKNNIKQIYDGYIFQLYAQYYSMMEMGYEIKQIKLYSMIDNKSYYIPLPKEDLEMDNKYRKLIKDMQKFNIREFKQTNISKCNNCIYEPACDRRVIC